MQTQLQLLKFAGHLQIINHASTQDPKQKHAASVSLVTCTWAASSPEGDALQHSLLRLLPRRLLLRSHATHLGMRWCPRRTGVSRPSCSAAGALRAMS